MSLRQIGMKTAAANPESRWGETPSSPFQNPEGVRAARFKAQACVRWLPLLCCALIAARVAPSSSLTAAETDHWAFQPITRPLVPHVSNEGAASQPIDRFVLSQLEAEGLTPSPEADRATLIRRLHLDLLGLPPSPDEVAAFVADNSPGAYGALVDRLLASPHFGERWGRHWLDLARYADSDGYLGDSLRTYAWVWRDWAIDAINADMPFDRFTIEQIAGDLLPNATLAQRVAAGFHRNTLKNTEAGADRELNRTKEAVDRVNTTGTVWLGLTVGCAECHEHKHDPITQEEFYGLYAFFNNTDETDVAAPRPLELARYNAALDEWDRDYDRLTNALADYEKTTLSARCAKWEAAFKPASTEWTILKPDKAESGDAATMTVQADGSVVASGKLGSTATATLQISNAAPMTVASIRIEVFGSHGEGKKAGEPVGRGPGGQFILSSLAFAVEAPGGKGVGQPLKSVAVTGGARAEMALDTKSNEGWHIASRPYRYHSAVFHLRQPVAVKEGSRLVFAMRQKHPSKNTLRHFRISVSPDEDVKPTQAPKEIEVLLAGTSAKRTAEQEKKLSRFHRDLDEAWQKLRRPIEKHLASKPSYPATKAQSLVERRKGRRETYVHIRGDYARRGKVVQAGAPDSLPALKRRAAEADRLDLARWLAAPENPLTARVTVNRIWQRLFGVGIVATSDDFGTKGAPPSHPLLLDWLASELIARDWSRKAVIREIVMSATYRQSSAVRPELADHPTGNRLLWRQNSFRLDAEAIRDSYLVASGLFDPRIGGPGIRPPLPAFVTEVGRSVKWPVSEGGDRYRRGLYIFFKRTVPYPMLISFDAPDSSVSCSRRERSNSPLQALTLLNDPVFYECAEALGGRMTTAHNGDDEVALREMFVRCLGREPGAKEMEFLAGALADLKKLGASGDAGARVEPMTALARIVMNLDEFITRD